MPTKRLKADTPAQYMSTVERLVADLQFEADDISQSLRLNVGHRDPSAHRRAYQDISRHVRDFLRRVPEPPSGESKPEARETGRSEIPFVVKNDAVFMGCPECGDWIDVSRVFSQQLFDGVYTCSRNHRVIFGGLTPEPATKRESEAQA